MKVYIAANDDIVFDAVQRKTVSYEDWCKAHSHVNELKKNKNKDSFKLYTSAVPVVSKLLNVGDYAAGYIIDILVRNNATDKKALETGLSNEPEYSFQYAFIGTNKTTVDRMLSDWRQEDEWDDD